MKLSEKMSDIANNDKVERIRPPRGIFLQMMSIAFLGILAAAVCWNGIFIIFSVFIFFPLAIWLRACYSVWRRYYSPVTFVVALLLQAVIAVGIVYVIR